MSKFGVRVICEENILQLKKVEDSTKQLVHFVFKATLFPPSDLLRFMGACERATFLHSCHSPINHDLTRSLTFICDYGKHQYTLDDICKIVKHLININQEVLSDIKEKWYHAKLFPLVYDYYRIIRGTSLLYIEFLRLLKHASDSWLSVKLALEHFIAKSRTCDDYSYREMVEQLNDLEAAEGINICDSFIRSFVLVCKLTVSFSRHFNKHIQDIEKFKSMITLAKVSSITNACILSIQAVYMRTGKLLQEMKGATSYLLWLHLIRSFLNKSEEWFPPTGSSGKELRIQDFSDSAVIVQTLKIKMAQFSSFTHQSEEEMMIAIIKLEKMMDNISMTIEDMRMHAHLYSLDIREAGITLNQFIVDSNLQVSLAGVRFMSSNEEQQYENPVSEAMAVLYQATLSLILTNLQWYMRSCEVEDDDSSLLSCHSTIHEDISSIIEIIFGPRPIGRGCSLGNIRKVVTHLHAINQEGFTVLSESKVEWRHWSQLFHLVHDYHKICLQTSELYIDYVRLLKDRCDSNLSAVMRMREYVVNLSQDIKSWTYEDQMTWHLNDAGKLILPGDFVKSLSYICKQTVAFTRRFDEEIQELKSAKVLAKVSKGLIAGVFSVMAAYMVDCTPLQWMKEKTLTDLWVHLIRTFSWKSPCPLWMGEHLVIKEFLDIVSLSPELNFRPTFANKEKLMIALSSFQGKIDDLLTTIEEMSRHAHKCSDDIIKAGKTLELISHNHMLPIKRKR